MRIVNLCLVVAALLALPSAAVQQPAPRVPQKTTAQQPVRPAAGAQKKPAVKPKPAAPVKKPVAESSLGSVERRALLASKGRTAAVKKPTKPVY